MKLKCEGANHAGEFIRPYSPDACPSGACPSVGPGYIVGVDTSLVPTVVGANHAGESIRRYSPDAGPSVGPGDIVGVDTSLVPPYRRGE